MISLSIVMSMRDWSKYCTMRKNRSGLFAKESSYGLRWEQENTSSINGLRDKNNWAWAWYGYPALQCEHSRSIYSGRLVFDNPGPYWSRIATNCSCRAKGGVESRYIVEQSVRGMIIRSGRAGTTTVCAFEPRTGSRYHCWQASEFGSWPTVQLVCKGGETSL